MANNMSTFKRYEKKYMLNTGQYYSLKERLAKYMDADKFDHYTICNIYYDTDTYEIIRRSIEKPVYKEKLRLRSYGIPKLDEKIYFELKKKYKKEVFKRRISLNLDEYEAYVSSGLRPDASRQVMDEIEYFLKMYQPEPKVFIAYERSALIGKEDTSLRITFDENLRFRDDHLSLRNGDYGKMAFDEDQYLMEIKVTGAMPLWLSYLLTEYEVFPTSFSKYGYCYKNFIHVNRNVTPKKNPITQVAS
jgi:SPX domain protein involved in polyphosphate accumulation